MFLRVTTNFVQFTHLIDFQLFAPLHDGKMISRKSAKNWKRIKVNKLIEPLIDSHKNAKKISI